MPSNKIYTFNHDVPNLISKITEWHYERNLINGSTDEAQAYKLLEEYTELVSSIYPDSPPEAIYSVILEWLQTLLVKLKIKTVPLDEAEEAKRDALGDMKVVQVNIAERNGLSIQQCLQKSWLDIKDRGGILKDGIYIKAEDINNESL